MLATVQTTEKLSFAAQLSAKEDTLLGGQVAKDFRIKKT
jgi:hypothetical protein